MEKFLSAMEIRALTRKEFLDLLISEGFKASLIKNDYFLQLSEISKDTFQYVCDFYGASGLYIPQTISAQIGNWGCMESMFDILPPEPDNIKEVYRKIAINYSAELRSSMFTVIHLRHISEKDFRKLMVVYNCRCGYYTEAKGKGILIYHVWN